ncbi:TrmB family transcriptional regulator [Haloplanus salilacus]|uniref:TrmB family transcriptional regulator n=1 Tax=Haloplanus salilacus TaxID=2949994 RepID=UPI0030CE1089
MGSDPTENPRSAAVEQLERFGLSSYAARTYVALAGLGTGTARDVSRVSDVPRTRVYDAVDELHDRGLVDVQQSSPKRFWATSAETTSRTFEREFRRRTDDLRTALTELESTERRDEQRGVWTVEGREAVADRLRGLLAEAEEEIVYMTVMDLLTDDLIDELHAAAERGVSIELAGLSEDVRERIETEVPEATTFESLWIWSDTAAGRLAMVDGRQTLVSVFVDDDGLAGNGGQSETAIWGEGETNSLVVVLRALFTWRLDGVDPSER